MYQDMWHSTLTIVLETVLTLIWCDDCDTQSQTYSNSYASLYTLEVTLWVLDDVTIGGTVGDILHYLEV